METKLNASLLRLFADLVQVVGSVRPVCQGGVRPQAERRDDNLFQPELVGIAEFLVQTFLEFPELDVATLATQPRAVDHAADFRGLHLHQRTKAGFLVSGRRAHFDHPISAGGNLPQSALEILSDRLPERIGLTPDGHSERVGFEFHRRRGDAHGASIKKFSS